MEWVPEDAWLTKVAIDAEAPKLKFDLAIDASGAGAPSRVDAGLDLPGAVDPTVAAAIRTIVAMTFVVGGIGGVLLLIRRRPDGGTLHPA